jgi:hypothetical protein
VAQFARPDADLANTGWTNEAASGTDLFQSLDETSANDSDFAQSASAPSDDPLVVRLSDVEDPVSSSGHTVRFRYKKNTTGGATINLTVELREGYVDEGTQGTLIASTVVNDIDSITTGSISLSGAEADAITDYTDLALRFVADQA